MQDRKPLERLTQRSVDAGEGSGVLPWFLMTRGMAAYRAGEYSAAVKWLEDPERSDLSPELRSTAKSYLAMAEFRLGHAPRARTLLSEAGELITARAALRDVGSSWHNLWIADLARHEAEALINPAPSQVAEPATP